MFLELIAVFVAGLGGAGVAMLLNRLTGGRLPRWLMPVAAGAAMLGTGISSEYSWFSRTSNNLPEGIEVAQTVQSRAAWRPWTYVFPMTDRFIALDRGSLRANTGTEALYMADLYFFGRWRPVTAVEIMVDCKEMRRADPALGDGSPPVWRDVGAEDPIVKSVCREV